MADSAPCINHADTKKICLIKRRCDYYDAFNTGMSSKVLITNYNYALGLSETGNPDLYTREITICDEGHVLEETLVNHASFDIVPAQLKQSYDVDVDPDLNFTDFETIKDVCSFISNKISTRCHDFNVAIRKFKQKLNAEGQQVEIDPAQQKLQRKLNALLNHHQRIKWYVNSASDEWVTELSEDGKKLTVQPLLAGDLFNKYFAERLTSPTGKIFIMSASLGNKSTIINELGIDEEDSVYIDVDTPFDPAKSPVIMMPVVKMGFHDFNASKHELIDIVDFILEEHAEHKGIIHSGNYKTAEWIANNSSHKDRFVYKQQGEFTSNGDLFAIHSTRDDSSVLISPSMHTGIDLRGSLAEFQIVAKLPFANMKDARVQAKMKLDDLWYANATWQKIIQACGRATRSENDESSTYIIDYAARYQYNKFKQYLPIWFKNRVQFIS